VGASIIPTVTFELAGLGLKELAIRHNQDLPSSPENTLESEQPMGEDTVLLNEDEVLRNRVLSGLQSLRISLVHEHIRGESGTVLKGLSPHLFAGVKAHCLAARRCSSAPR
jgi:hypothetical protein